MIKIFGLGGVGLLVMTNGGAVSNTRSAGRVSSRDPRSHNEVTYFHDSRNAGILLEISGAITNLLSLFTYQSSNDAWDYLVNTYQKPKTALSLQSLLWWECSKKIAHSFAQLDGYYHCQYPGMAATVTELMFKRCWRDIRLQFGQTAARRGYVQWTWSYLVFAPGIIELDKDSFDKIVVKT